MQTTPSTTPRTTPTSTAPTAPAHPPVPEHADVLADQRHARRVRRVIGSRSFAVLSSVSDAGFPHSAGVVYASVGTTLYVHTFRSSRKARNVAGDQRVAIVIPVRRLPVGPPFSVQFQARAELLALDDREVVAHLRAGRLDAISGHGAFEEPDGCVVRIVPTGRIHTYGIGVSAIAVARDPLHVGARLVEVVEGVEGVEVG